MKTKLLLAAALIGVASLSAQAGVFVGVSVGLPAPRVVVAAPVPVLVAPAAPILETVPACPGPGYVWVAGYWSGYGPARSWVAGCWRPPVRVVYAHPDRGHADHFGHGDHGYGSRH
jgi:hypothetical protein